MNSLIRTLSLSFATAVGIVSFSAAACSVSGNDAQIEVKQFFPYAELSTQHWPRSYTLPIGGVVSFLAPKGTVLTLRALSNDSSNPLVQLQNKEFDKANDAQRIRFVDGQQPVAFNSQKYEWIRVFAATYGKTEAVLTGPRGWKHRIELGVVYRSAEEAAIRPPLFAQLPSDDPPSLRADGYDNIVLSVPGEIGDHWTLVDETEHEIGFKLTRIEVQQVPYLDAPRVKLFLSGTRSPGSGTASIKRTGASGEVVFFRFKIVAMSTAAC